MATSSRSPARKSGAAAQQRAPAKRTSGGTSRSPKKTATARSTSRTSRAASTNGRKTNAAKRTSAAKSSNAAKRSSAAQSRNASTSSSSRPTAARTSSQANRNGSGAAATVKHAASKAKGPALAVGAAVAGVAGGVVLRNRTRHKTMLGVPLPRSIARPDVDPKSVLKTVGHASRQFARTTKSVSKDLERVGDQAERIGKVLD